MSSRRYATQKREQRVLFGTRSAPLGKVVIHYLYLDQSVCRRCQATDTIVEAAVGLVAPALDAAGYRVSFTRIEVTSEAIAIRHRFVSSPTIQVNGYDIAGPVRENRCDSCGALCGDSIDCRVWTWRGRTYTAPPLEMIVHRILEYVFAGPDRLDAKEANAASRHGETEQIAAMPDGDSPDGHFELPDNLKRFFAARKRKETDAKSDT